MFARTRHLTLFSGIVVCAFAMAACQPDHSGGGKIDPSHIPTAPQQTAGTGDSGGGNGLDGKFFETFAIEPMKTVEWMKYISPILTNIRLAHEGHFSPGTWIEMGARAKRWYVAPVKLVGLSKKQVGVDFIQDPMQQHALQTAREVWIEKSFWDPSDDVGRATGLLHEAMMNLYMMKFMKNSEACRVFQYAVYGHDVDCSEYDKRPDEEPLPARALNETDYTNIRAMTAWLMANGANVRSAKEVVNQFRLNDFDRRLFIDHSTPQNTPPPEEWSGKELPKRFADATLAGRTPLTCRMSLGDRFKMVKCPTTFTIAGRGSKQGLEVKVEIPAVEGISAKKTVRGFMPTSQFYEKFTPALSRTAGSRERSYSVLMIHGLADGESLARGKEVYLLFAAIAEDYISVKSVTLSSAVVTSVKPAVGGKIEFETMPLADHLRTDAQIIFGEFDESLRNQNGNFAGSVGELYVR